ncbi:MAG: TolC family protein [Acidobacteria bacterium]|nr:TolC family protein [Acidobacteriota bacterium]
MPVAVGAGSRRSARAVAVVAFLVLLLAPAHRARAQDPVSPVPRRPLGRDVPVYFPSPGDQERREAPVLQNPTGALTLGEAVALALLHNPGLAGFAWEMRAREARMIQAGRPPNPVLSTMVQDLGGNTGFTGVADPIQAQTTIELGQLVERGGKRAARQRLAAAGRDLAGWDYETARIDVLTEVSRTFTDVLAAQETVALTEETSRLVQQVLQSVSARVEAGVVSPIEATRATVAVAAVRIESARARRVLDGSRARLALLWGSATPAFTGVVGNLKTDPAPLPPMTDLLTRLEQSPELARWAAEISQREAAFGVERSKRAMDVEVVGGYRRYHEIDSHAFVIGASIPLPLFDRNRGGIDEARIRLAKAHEERRAVQARVAAALADAYAALAGAHDEVTALRSAVLPGSQETFDAVTEGYRLGKFGYLDVLDAQRTLIAAGSQYLRALSAYYKAVADVERLIGAPLTGSTGLPTIARE